MIPQEITAIPQEKQKTTPPKSDTTLQLRYFYGNEVSNISFYMTPKLMFRNNELSKLTSDSKWLYVFMLDRLKLSSINGFREKDGRLYIFYTIEEACYELHKTNKPVCNAFSQLESTGLIERHKRGQGKADKIYVKNIDSVLADYPTFRDFKRDKGEPLPYGGQNFSQNYEQNITSKAQNQGVPPIPTVEPQPEIPQNYPQYTEFEQNPSLSYVDNSSKITEITVDNFSHEENVHFQNRNTSTTRNVESPFLEVANVHGNNTDVTNTENNNTDLLKPTLPPNSTATYPQFHHTQEFRERWGEGWEDMSKETKLYVLESELTQGYQNEELEYLLYNYRTNKDTMSLVLDHLMGMQELDYMNGSNSECSQEQFFYKATKLYKQALLEMMTEERHTKTKHGYISYSKVMEKVLSHLKYQDYCHSVKLDNIVDCTVKEYMDAAAETTIRHKLNYMKTCIWSTFLTGNIYDEQNFHKFATDINLSGYERNYPNQYD